MVALTPILSDYYHEIW